MKETFLAIALLLLTACNNPSTQNSSNVSDTSNLLKEKQEESKEELDSLHNPYHQAYLSNLPIREVAMLILKDSIRPLDNYVTFRCMDSLLSNYKETRDFYFPVFLKICKKADGALAEALGTYVLKYVEQYPREFLQRRMKKDELEGFASSAAFDLAYYANGDIKNTEKWVSSIEAKCIDCDFTEILKLKEFNQIVLKLTKESMEDN